MDVKNVQTFTLWHYSAAMNPGNPEDSSGEDSSDDDDEETANQNGDTVSLYIVVFVIWQPFLC